ncbi:MULTISPECIES: glycerophosphodiester phosphodiesterase [Citromicrobium]|uniref:glycerophosphodiester phosphodiesterase n=1 Tax=Citromicrobium TaxID=72173 RepID=UPI00058B8EEA|nr:MULTISPECIES: glycerophosphodiester phosphodiesterase [Citromicrobium]ALG59611.1 glycerophosphodiester phosphodiesterase [Citromicrobium sp. JL477]KPM17282.1 glycerophosphodiester phosphodiesterase [Citromicrobium sp. JL1351]KPM20220.1 glycerophosphodiester phosphodiesterase [Citromicrobium sp. JL31]KPM29236.1 glycerophosphodiester phosphodiesterase [Citromicrobium sp. JL2201]
MADLTPVNADGDTLIIAHRGASGERPEHTLASYERAIDQGADYIEPDLVVTKDLVLVARHENEIGETTNVADHPEFADRRRTKNIEGQMVNGWFAEDFTLAELQTLRAKERMPALRPANARFDGLYAIPTFADIIALKRAKEAETGRKIGLYPELKHPTWLLQESGIDTVDLLVRQLKAEGLDGADSDVFVQVFDIAPLQRLDKMIDAPLILLIRPEGGPYDEPGITWAGIMTPTGLAEVATYADGIGPWMGHVLNDDGTPTDLVRDAHAAGLKVHPWTVRKENVFLPASLRSDASENGIGDIRGLVKLLKAAGVDGYFTDDPGLVRAD